VRVIATERPWHNWAGNQACRPAAILRASTEAALVDAVCRAADEGRNVRAVGAGHSFTPLVCTDGYLLDLGDYGRVLSHDPEAGTVTVQAGIPLWRLSAELAERGLALENMGDIAYQSIAGATSTATHGTGARFGNLSSRVVGLGLVTGDGTVIECSPTVHPDVLDGARVGLGALGVLSTVTVQCVPAFNLHAIEEPMRVDDVMANLDQLVEGNDHFEFFWVPNTGWALTKRNRRTTDPVAALPRWRSWRDQVLYDNVGFGLMCRIGRWRNDLIPAVARRLPSAGRTEYTDVSYKVFASPRLVHFYEMEYAIPAEALPEAFGRVRELVRRLGVNLSFPVEVRMTAADDIPLSTAYGRDTAYVAVHVYRGTPYDEYFQGVESVMDDYDGRPHWGKLHFQTASSLASRYPRWDEFQALRARLDPTGVFTTPYLERVLGPTPANR